MTFDLDLQSIQEVRNLCQKAKEAQKILAEFSQEQVDRIVEAMAIVGSKESENLARLAVQETGLGVYEDKITKNRFAAEIVYDSIKDIKTVGIIREIPEKKVYEIAEPMGVVAAITPVTNPTSTAIYKSLISLKARNAIVLSPHPQAKRCTKAAADRLEEAATKVGAPSGAITCMSMPTMEGTRELMHHKDVAIILATGGTGLVKAAYSAGKPAYGVGPGNVPVYIERTADIRKAVRDIMVSKCFDNGTICSSEQAVIVDEPIKEGVIKELEGEGAYFLSPEERKRLEALVITPDGGMNPETVGQPAQYLAKRAGITVPPETRVLVAFLEGVGKDYPLSREKLTTILAFYSAKDWRAACERCIELLNFMGIGHTLVIHSRNEEVIREFALKKPAFRILVNTPGSQGAIGFSTGLDPALTLGCGTWGGGISSDNITPLHLINIKRLAYETRRIEDISRILDGRSAKEIGKEVKVSPTLTEEEIARIVSEFLKERKKSLSRIL